MFKRRISIQDKLITYLVFLSIFAILAISMISYFMAGDALKERTFSQLTSIKTVKERQLENFFRDRINDLTLLHKILNNEINKRGNKIDLYNFAEDLHQSKKDFFHKLYIIKKGNSEVSDNTKIDRVIDLSLLDSLKIQLESGRKTEVYYTDMYINTISNEPEFLIGIEVGKTQKYLILFKIPGKVINEIMLESKTGSGFGESGETYLVGHDRLMRSTSKFSKNTVLKTKVNTEGVQEALSGISATNIFNDYRDIEVLSSYSKPDLKIFDWALMVEIDLQEALAPVHNLRNFLILLSVTLTLIVFIAAVLIAKKFSRPVINLKGATSEISKGNFNYKLKRTTSDEIGDLTDAFNDMTESIKGKNREIEREKSLRYNVVVDAQEKERERLSRELHDGLGQTFIGLKLHLEGLKSTKDKDIDEKIKSIIDIVDLAIDDIRRISNDLMPSVLKEFGLKTAIKNLVDDITSLGDIEIEQNINKDIDIKDKKTIISIFRIIQETLNNAVKYSSAEKISLSLRKQEKSLIISVKDNGVGFEPENISGNSGNGLYNIKERVTNLGGTANIRSKPFQGTEILIHIPYNENN